MDTCGCVKAPRGGFPRTTRVVNLTKERNPETPVLLVNVGGWLDDTIGINGVLRNDVKLANEWMLKGLELAGWDAVNIGFQDLPYLDSLREFPQAGVSGNMASVGEAALPHPYLLREFGGLKVAITGVSGAGLTFIEPEHYRFRDPVEALNSLLPRLNAEADLVVVLGYGLGRQARSVAELPGIDVFIEGDRFHSHFGTSWEGNTLWLRSRYETQALGELRLWLVEGTIRRGLERKIALDDQIAPDPALNELLEKATDSLSGARRALFNPSSTPSEEAGESSK
jgi:2',3'-cyclic-nucleotide 2'-phosphodiesterase (5'-nucleotidase family)